jgi:hypothetical protein
MHGAPPPELPPDLLEIREELEAVSREARAIVGGLDDAQGNWQPDGGRAWSVAQCLDHLATANSVYLDAMEPAIDRARGQGRLRLGPVAPGYFAAWFIRSLEPPVRLKSRNPGIITPASALPVDRALSRFLGSQERAAALLASSADLDLATRFANPFVPGLRFRVQAGFRIIVAHDRRHLWQARRVIASAGFPSS